MHSRTWCLLALLLVACSRDQKSDESIAMPDVAGVPAREAAAPAPPALQPAPADAPVAQGPQATSPTPDSLPASMIIRTGTAEVEVKALEPAVDSVRALVTRLGGHVVDMSMQVGENQRREARIVARIPSPRFDGAVAGLAPLGDLQSVNVSAQDVGEEYVDLQAQLSNRRRLEQRLLQLLETRTGRLEDVLAVERELARVREEIDRQEGRLRYLRNQVSLSTLTIVLREPAPLGSEYRGQNVFGDALRSAWRNFIGLLVTLIASLGVVLPLGVLAYVVWLVVRSVRRRRAAAKS